jgi:predicted nuclease of predicted toxin-antitoxin system
VRLLLDAHVPPAVAIGLAARISIEALALRDWEGGVYLNADDDTILRTAYDARWTLVTYDRRTIQPLLRVWGERGIPHGGVIFVDDRTIPQQDVGGLIRALQYIVETFGGMECENRIHFLISAR